MKIELQSVAKRYNYDWIFRNLDYTFNSGNYYAIIGPNGSGKSTLLKVIAGQLSPSSGKIIYSQNNKNISIDDIYQNISWCAPYVDVIEEYAFEELVNFHKAFKKLKNGISTNKLIEIAQLNIHSKKQLKYYSSGMKQRVKLALALLSDVDVILLDEPTTNLDTAGVEWYLQLIKQYANDKLVIVGSNIEREYAFCTHAIEMSHFKLV